MHIKILLRDIIYILIYYSKLLDFSILFLDKIFKHFPIVILFYHRFSDIFGKNNILFKLKRNLFIKQLNYINKRYKIISMDDAFDLLVKNRTIKEPLIVLTIDDGYLDNYTIAYPILKSMGVPFLIYLTAGFVGTRNGPWVDDLEFSLLNTNVREFSLPGYFGNQVFSLANITEKIKAEKIIFKKFLYLEHNKKLKAMDQLIDILDTSDQIKERDRLMLNWEEVKQMHNAGVFFGSHTMTHPTLSKMPLEEAKFELLESKRVIEEKIGSYQVNHFAIPNGKDDDFSPLLEDYAKEIGYKTIATTQYGSNYGRDDLFKLKRICPHERIEHFAAQLARLLFFNRKV